METGQHHLIASNYVLSSIMDSEGNIWIATYLGLNKLLPESGIIISYTDDRLGYNLSFNEGEPILGNDGNIYFNTNMGLLYFDPENISHNSYRPEIYIKSCYINGKKAILDTKDNGTPYIRTRRSNRLIIDFNSVDIINPDGVTYSYRIGSRSWKHIGNNSTIILDKLRPGRYKLEVKSTNAEGYEVNNTFSTEILVQIDIIHIIFGIAFVLSVCSLVMFYIRKRNRIRESESNTERDRFIERFNSFIEANMDNSSLGVNEIAVEFGMSRSSFYNRINGYIGQSPAEYIRDARLKRACELLQSKDLSIAQIAYMTGFNDPHYFGKAFKKEFGMTPTEFRKKNQA